MFMNSYELLRLDYPEVYRNLNDSSLDWFFDILEDKYQGKLPEVSREEIKKVEDLLKSIRAIDSATLVEVSTILKVGVTSKLELAALLELLKREEYAQ